MKSLLSVIALASVISAAQAEIVSHTYWVSEKNISIFYPDSNPEWDDQLHGAYCRNAVYKELKSNDSLRKQVKEAECLHLEDQEVKEFTVSNGYDQKNQKLTIPFNFVKGKREYPLYKEIIDYVKNEEYLNEKTDLEKIVEAEDAAAVIEVENLDEDEKVAIETSEMAQENEATEEVLTNDKNDIKEFVDSFSSKYSSILKGLPYIPKDAKLRESFRVFITKMKTDPDADGLSIGSLTGAFKFFEENRNGIQDKTYMKKAKDNGSGAKSYNWEGIRNQDYIVIVNYTISRYKKRFFVLNLKDNKIYSTMAAHGYGSNTNGKYSSVPGRFSNTNGSGMTSRGFYLSAGTYCSGRPTFGSCRGDNGSNAVYLDGLSENNWRAKERAVVFHGATYVSTSGGASGNSAGCPAIPLSKWLSYHSYLKTGTLFYHYTNSEYSAYKKSLK